MKQHVAVKLAKSIFLICAVALFSLSLSVSRASAQDDASLPTKPITIQVVEAPVKVVLDELFKSVGLNYTIDPAVTGDVTVNLTNIPFNSALHVILQAANPPLTFTVSDDVYSIKPKATTLTTGSAGPAASVPAANTTVASAGSGTDEDTTAAKQVKRIQLNYVDAASLMMYVLGGGSVLPSLTNQLSGGFGGSGGSSGFGNTGSSGFGSSGFGSTGSSGFGGSSFGGSSVGGSSFGSGFGSAF